MFRQAMKLLVGGALLISLGVAAGRPALAGSGCPASPAELAAVARSASDAFSSMNSSGFDTAFTTLTEQLTCLSGTPDARQAATVHMVEALAAFRTKDQNGTRLALQAMYESDPSLVLGETLAPKGGPLDRRVVEARALPPALRAPHNLGLTVFVDGRPAESLPTTRPALVVVLDGHGGVRWSGMVPAGASIPVQPEPPAEVDTRSSNKTVNVIPEPPPKGIERSARHTKARPLLIAAGGSALVTGVLGAFYVPAYRRVTTAGELIETEAPPEDWEEQLGMYLATPDDVYPLYDRARALGVATVVAAGATVGLGTIGLVIRW